MAEEVVSSNDLLASAVSSGGKRTENSAALMVDTNKGSNIERLLSDLKTFANVQSNYLKTLADNKSSIRVRPEIKGGVVTKDSDSKEESNDNKQSIIALATKGALEGVLGRYAQFSNSIFDMFNESKKSDSRNVGSQQVRNTANRRTDNSSQSNIIRIDYNIGSNLGNTLNELKALSQTQTTYLKQIVDYNNELKNALMDKSVSDAAQSNRSSVGSANGSIVSGAGAGAASAGGIIDAILGGLETIIGLVFGKKIYDAIKDKVSGNEKSKPPEEKSKVPEEKVKPSEGKGSEPTNPKPKEGSTTTEPETPKERSSTTEPEAPKEKPSVIEPTAPKEGPNAGESAAPKEGQSASEPTTPKEGSSGSRAPMPNEGATASAPEGGKSAGGGSGSSAGSGGSKGVIAKGTDIFEAAVKRYPRFGTFLKFAGEIAIAWEVASILMSDDTTANKVARLTGPLAGFFATGPGIALGAALGAAMGIESGPGLILTGIIGGGLAYFAADWLATQVALWLVNEAFESDYKEGPTVSQVIAPKNRGDVARTGQRKAGSSISGNSRSSLVPTVGFNPQMFADTTAKIPDAILDPISKQGLINSAILNGPDRDRQNIRPRTDNDSTKEESYNRIVSELNLGSTALKSKSDQINFAARQMGLPEGSHNGTFEFGVLKEIDGISVPTEVIASINQNVNISGSTSSNSGVKTKVSSMLSSPMAPEKSVDGSKSSVVVIPPPQTNGSSNPNIVNSHNTTTTIIQKTQDPAGTLMLQSQMLGGGYGDIPIFNWGN